MIQLKFALFLQDFYNRLKSNYSNSVYVENDIDQNKSYKIEFIIDKRVKKFEKTSITQYKVKWLKSEFDKWKFIFKLENCMKLIKNYEKLLIFNIQRKR